jgi:protein arginine kinase activator
MKCQKCPRTAAVHLTEVITEGGGAKRAVEIHLCLVHAVDAGLIAPEVGLVPLTGPGSQPQKTAGFSSSIVPAPPATGALTVVRGKEPADASVCPVCGLTWGHFKQAGVFGCPHDYLLFEARLTPLLKRAQEGVTEHVGKVPPKRKTQEVDRQVASLRLRRELQKALDAENYEKAARLRDQLRVLEKN